MRLEAIDKHTFMEIGAEVLAEVNNDLSKKTGESSLMIPLLGSLILGELTHKLFDKDPEDKLTKQLEGDKNDSQH